MSLFNKIAPIYALFFDFQVRYFQRIEKRGREYIDISKYKSVLDVGCGTGALCKVLKDKGLEVTGVEPSLGMLKQAKKKLRGEDIILKQVTPEERFPFKNKSFDLVITSYVAHGLKPRERIWLYKEMRRLSKEVVIIHDYNKTRGLMTTIVEWLENGDYFNFIKVAQREMEKVFENVEVGNVDTRAAWYICSPKKRRSYKMEKLLAKRKEDSHKGSYGKIAIIAGSRGMTGSAYLSCQAALRTGSGLVYALVAQSLEAIMSIKLTEAIIKGLEDKGKGHLVKESIDGILRETSNMDALAIGPGIGVDRERVDLLRELIKSAEASMVIDADGLNCLSKDMDMLKDKKTSVIITPHPGEMGRMLNLETQEIESKREYHAQTLSEKYDVITILKGHKTIVACPQGQIYTNLTGNPGMATAGSGDVLTGILASLLGQGLEPYQAARLGVYLHGLAGDIARDKKGEYGMIASDIVEAIPYAIMEIGKK